MLISLLINPFESALMAVESYYKTIKKQSNMKSFDLEKAKQGHPVQTRDGRDVEILKTDVKSNDPIVAVVRNNDRDEIVRVYKETGRYEARDIARGLDLFMKATKKEGWINVFRVGKLKLGTPFGYWCGDIHKTKQDALQAKIGKGGIYIDTIKIEWEE
jgi:hypothetical protein